MEPYTIFFRNAYILMAAIVFSLALVRHALSWPAVDIMTNEGDHKGLERIAAAAKHRFKWNMILSMALIVLAYINMGGSDTANTAVIAMAQGVLASLALTVALVDGLLLRVVTQRLAVSSQAKEASDAL